MIKFINLIKDATIKIPRILFLPLFPATLLAQTINFTIDPTLSNNAINPFSYGSNASITAAGGVPVTNTFYRQGGNRMSAYNWENNASNAGTDWYNESDWYLVPNGVTAPGTPATTISAFVHGNNNIGADSLITLQMAGYVAADGSCVCTPPVTAVNDTTNTYWKAVSFVKGSPFADPPVTTDNNVYMDELMYYLGTHVGYSSSGGAKLYDLDNEPALWNSTHPMVHPAQAACSEVAGKGVSLAAVITQYDSGAQILGPVAYGWGEYTNNQSAPDTIVLGPYNNGNLLPYLNYYLAQFNTASTSKGRRLLHYLDLHWYPEALGNNGVSLTRITVDDVSQGVAVARMQAPRSLWDPSYSENSWITWGTGGGPITLIPRLQNAVSQYYPGTKLFFSEYQYGAGEDISGGVAEADALGIFTKYGVGASWWPDSSVNDYYLAAAYRLYLNYDGAGSKFGDTSILATSSGANAVSWTSVYAAKNSGNPNQVNVILINKDYGTDHAAAVTLNSLGTTQIYSITAYRFDTGASQIYSPAAPAFNANSFSVTLPHRSATLYKITLLPPGTTPTNTPSPTATSTPSNSPTRTPQNTSTSTPTHSPTKTPSNTPTNSLTDTPSKTATNSPTATFSSTPTNSATNSPSLTPTPSPTHSPTPTATGSPSNTPTFTVTDTPTQTATGTMPTDTNTPTTTAISTLTFTFTATPTPTLTMTDTASNTMTGSPTDSATSTPTSTPSGTATKTATLTATGTPTNSATGTSTHTPTFTSTHTFPPTVTYTPTLTFTFTSTTTSAEGLAVGPVTIYDNPATLQGPVTVEFTVRNQVDHASLKVFTTAFRKVREVPLENLSPGLVTFNLDLVDNFGTPLANGIYFLVITTPRGRSIGKLLVLR